MRAKPDHHDTLTGPRRILFAATMLVGLHSITLGAWMYLATAPFYRLFFRSDPPDPFFARQAGLFLICLGLFYLAPLLNLGKYHRLILLIVVTKALAVIFLLTSAGATVAPAIIRLGGLGDGTVGLLLLVCYVHWRWRHSGQKNRDDEHGHAHPR